MSFNNVLMVGLGGSIGSILRYFISFYIGKFIPQQFPYGTMAVNFLGCFTIGILMAIFTHKIEHNEMKLFFTTGMMGGLTTFSTFSYETFNLFREEEYIKASINISLSLLGCLILTFLGYRFCLNIIRNG